MLSFSLYIYRDETVDQDAEAEQKSDLVQDGSEAWCTKRRYRTRRSTGFRYSLSLSLSLSIYIYIYICVCVCVSVCVCVYMCVYVYAYV